MKNLSVYTHLGMFFLGCLLVFLLFRSCEKSGVIIPEKSGSFKPIKPEQKIITVTNFDTIIKWLNSKSPSNNKYWKTEAERLLKEYNSLDSVFMRSNDSLQQQLYRSAISIKAFSQSLENDTISINAKGLVKGEIESMQFDWKIKPFKAQIPQTTFRLLAGAEFGIKTNLKGINAKGSFVGQFRNGNQFSFGVDTEQRFYFGYAVSLFEVKR